MQKAKYVVEIHLLRQGFPGYVFSSAATKISEFEVAKRMFSAVDLVGDVHEVRLWEMNSKTLLLKKERA